MSAVNIAPPKLLSVSIRSQEIVGYWSSVPTDPEYQVPRQWRYLADVNPQLHSSSTTPRPYQYDGRDIVVGDYIATESRARLIKIISIINQGNGTIEFVGEDEDKINLLTDPTQYRDGSIIDGVGLLFEVKNGIPILFPLPDVLPAQFDRGFAYEIYSRFQLTDKAGSLSIIQPNHGFAVGQVLTLNDNGVYTAIDASQDITQNSRQIIGVVESIHFPTYDHFSIRTIGPVITINLDGGPGELHYIDTSSTTGNMFHISPNLDQNVGSSQPLYIKIDNNTAVFNFAGSLNIANVTTAFVVNNITELNALTVFREGDTVYVRDRGDGVWAYYVYNGSGWESISNANLADVDAHTKSKNITYLNGTITKIHDVGRNTRVLNVSVKVLTPFNDSNTTLTIGDNTDNSKFMSSSENDLSVAGSYHSFPNILYNEVNDKAVNAYLSTSASTGIAEILITYV